MTQLFLALSLTEPDISHAKWILNGRGKPIAGSSQRAIPRSTPEGSQPVPRHATFSAYTLVTKAPSSWQNTRPVLEKLAISYELHPAHASDAATPRTRAASSLSTRLLS